MNRFVLGFILLFFSFLNLMVACIIIRIPVSLIVMSALAATLCNFLAVHFWKDRPEVIVNAEGKKVLIERSLHGVY